MNFRLNEFVAEETPTTAEPTTPESKSTGVVFPSQPTSIEETGLNMGFLSDLILKVIYFGGSITARKIEETTKLPFLNIIDKVLNYLKMEEFVDIIGSEGDFSERSFQYVIARKGINKIHEILERSQYAGAAPVPLQEYVAMVKRHALGNMVVDQATIREAFSNLVVNNRMLDRLGPAANSARSLFLYGPPGNGKTTFSEGIANLLQGNILIPYAVEVDGQVIKIFDPLNHKVVTEHEVAHSEENPFGKQAVQHSPDARWIECKRPHVVVGGELILDQLELIYDPITKVYEAPFQMKSNGGIFLIDDFGRQKCRPQDLLNRWIVPLEKQVDYLALQTGKKIAIPFDVLIIFSTNLSPKDLVDDAFLRRIRHKIEVPNPTPNEFREIFKRVAKAKKIPYSDDGLRYLIQEHYMKTGRDLRACHPRDLCDQILDESKYRGVPPSMTKELLDRACEAYFVSLT